MRETTIIPENSDASSSNFDTVIEWLLIGLLLFMPLALGAVKAWSQEIVIALSSAIVILFALKLLYYRTEPVIRTWAYAALAVFILISAFQLVALPAWLISVISPNTVMLKTNLLGDLPNADTLLKSMTLSFYPTATKHDLRLVLSVAAVFVVVLNVFRRPDQIKRLLTAIALIGGFVALIAMAQDLFGNGKIYGLIAIHSGEAYSGPFVNHSHYGQFMNLSIGAALARLCVKLHEDFAGKERSLPAVFEYFSSSAAKSLWLLVAIISLGAATVFVSLTRGGIVSMLVAIAFTTALLARRQATRGHGWIIVVIILGAFSCILYLGFDAVYDRLATLRNLDGYHDRWRMFTDLVISFKLFPVLGTGLGTYSVVYPMLDSSMITALASHAENEYAQAAAETGLVGLAALIVFAIVIVLNFSKCIRRTRLPVCSAAYGLGFGIIAILIHSLSDFGQHIMANAFLTAIFCAFILILARISKTPQRTTQSVTVSGGTEHLGVRYYSRPIRMIMFLGICLVCLWALIGANRFRIAESHWAKVRRVEKILMDNNWQGTDDEYADLISSASQALARQPDNIKYRYWLSVYRWRKISRLKDPDTGTVIIPEDSMPVVRDIIDQFHKTRVLCPTYGPAYSSAGQIEKFIMDDDSGAERIRKGFQLAPCDPIACFAAGRLDILEGNNDDSIAKFNKAFQLDPTIFRDVVDIYVNYLSRPNLAVTAAGDNIGRLNYVADVLDDMQYSDIAEQVRGKIKNLLEVRCSEPDASAWEFVSLARIYARRNDDQAAIKYYHRALAMDYAEVHWRLTLAKLLVKTEAIPQAFKQARICLRLRPEFKPAERLIADLSVHPMMLNEESLAQKVY